MSKVKLTALEIEKRFEEINAREPEKMTANEIASLKVARAMDDGTTISLDEYKKSKEYSGKMFLRVPRELHEELAKSAAANGVSLNQYALYKLSRP